jgi:hypothetical protein
MQMPVVLRVDLQQVLQTPVGGASTLANLAQGKKPKNNIKEVDPDSDTGKVFTGIMGHRCNQCSIQGWPADCTSKGFTAENCASV